MRFLSLQSPAGRPHVRMLYEELAKHGVLVDAVIAPVEPTRAERLIRAERAFSGLFAHDAWIVPLVECAIARQMCVVVFLRTVEEWYALEDAGLVRQVDLFVFEEYATVNQLNRNLNHVVVEDFRADAPLLLTVLRNTIRHHKYRRLAVKELRAAREHAAEQVKQLCQSAYDGEQPSFVELQHFLDAMHSEGVRQRLVLNFRALLGRRASVREIRALADPPKSAPRVQDEPMTEEQLQKAKALVKQLQENAEAQVRAQGEVRNGA